MVHVLFVLDFFHPHLGGMEELFDDIAQYCSKEKKIRISILTSKHNPSLLSREKRDDITIYRVWRWRRSSLFSFLWFGLTHRRMFQTIDHIHTSTYASALPAFFLAKYYKKPCTITIHELYGELWYHLKWSKARLYIFYEWLICRLPWKTIVTPSHSSKATIINRYPRIKTALQVIPNQLDKNFRDPSQVSLEEQEVLLATHNISPHDHIFLFIGRLWYEKWLPYLIEAYSQLDLQYKKRSKLIIIWPKNPQNYPKRIQQQIHRVDRHIRDNYLSSSVVRLDPEADQRILRTRMSIATRGVVPSASEGFGYIAAKMQAMTLPLILSDVWALNEIITADSSVFVPYGKVEAIKQALQKSIDHPSTTTNFKASKTVSHNNQESDKSKNTINYINYAQLFTKRL